MKMQVFFTREGFLLLQLIMVLCCFRIFHITSALALVVAFPPKLDPSLNTTLITPIFSIITISISNRGGLLQVLIHLHSHIEMLLLINCLIWLIILTSHLLHGAATKVHRLHHPHGAPVAVDMAGGVGPKVETTAGD